MWVKIPSLQSVQNNFFSGLAEYNMRPQQSELYKSTADIFSIKLQQPLINTTNLPAGHLKVIWNQVQDLCAVYSTC